MATGASVGSPANNEYGFGLNPDTVTLDQYEQLLTASSSWKGSIKLLSDPTKSPDAIAFVLCFDRHILGYCSKYCCLGSAAAVRQTAEKLPDSIQDLNLSNNKLTKIENIGNLVELRYLDLDTNQVTRIKNLDNLTILYLD